MSTFFKLCSWLVATTCSTSLGAVCTGEWTGAGTPDNNWSVVGNWSSGCVPSVDGDSASFGLAGPTPVINLDIPVTLTNLTFNNPSQNFTIGPGGMVLQGFAGVNPTINVDSGTQTFNQDIQYFQPDTLFLNVDGTLNANGLIVNPGPFNLADMVVDGTGIINVGSGLVALLANNYTQNGVTINNHGFVGADLDLTINNGIFNNFGTMGSNAPGALIVNGGFLNNTNTGFVQNLGPVVINGGSVLNNGFFVSQTSSITINGGLFQNDGDVQAFSTITVNAPGVVTGTGFFESPFFNNGTVIPGDLPGTLFFGEYTQTAAGDLVINVLNSTVYGSIASFDIASLDGTLTVAPYPGFAGITPGTPLTIVTANTAVTGTFSNIVDLFPSLRAEVFYFPTSVVLELFPILNSFVSFKEVTFSSINQINLLLVNHMDRMVDPCCCPEYSLQFYVDPLGSTGKVHSHRDLSGYRFNTGGVLAGVDMYLSDGGIGLAFDYQRVYAKGFNDFGNFASNKYHFSGYGTYLIDSCFQIDAIVGGGWEKNHLRRSTGFFGDESTKADPNGYSFDAFLGAEYFMNVCDINFIPLAGLQYIYYNINRFHEKGVTFFDNAYDKQHYDSLRSLLGFKLNHIFNVGCFQIVPQVNAAWQYEFLDRSKTFFASNIDFVSPATPIFVPRGGQNIVLAGADLAVLYDRYTLDVSYEYEGNKRYYNHFFYLELAAAF